MTASACRRPRCRRCAPTDLRALVKDCGASCTWCGPCGVGHVLVDDGQIESVVRAVVAADVDAALELLDMPTLPDTLRATRVHGTA